MATGKGSYFRLGNPTTLTNISTYIRTIETSNEAEEVDGTVITSTKREFEPSYEREKFMIRLKWTPAAAAFCRLVKGATAVSYEYGPEGNAAGKEKLTGTVNVLKAQSISSSSPGQLSELSLELNINSETVGVFP